MTTNENRVLERFLNGPEKELGFEDLRSLRELTGESRITEALRSLVNAKILEEINLSGRPRKVNADIKDYRIARKHYRIIQKLETFEKVFHLYLKKDIDALLRSNFANNMIMNFGLSSINSVLFPYLKDNRLKRAITIDLLGLTATIMQFKDENEIIKEIAPLEQQRTQIDREHPYWQLLVSPNYARMKDRGTKPRYPHRLEIKKFSSERIKMLNEFDHLYAIDFYRNTIYKEIEKINRCLFVNSIITEGLFEFMKYDLFLSPFTSYPFQTPHELLFTKPFQRIYRDFYLMNEKDLLKLKMRGYSIYTHFSDILFEHFRNYTDFDVERIKRKTSELIYLWNVSSQNFDIIFNILGEIYEEKIGSGKYNVSISERNKVNITDLETDKMLHERVEVERIDGIDIEVPYVPFPEISTAYQGEKGDFENIAKSLRPCECFKAVESQSNKLSAE